MKIDPILNEDQLNCHLDSIDNKLESINKRMSLAHFNQLTGEEFESLELINNELILIMLDKQNFAVIDEWKDKAENFRLKRRLEIFRNNFLQARVNNDKDHFRLQNSLQQKIIDFKPKISNVEVSGSERNKILESEPDRDLREEAYYAGKKLDGMIESELLELMTKRNNLAQKLGYEDYVQFGLTGQELNENELKILFESIREQTDEVWEQALKDIKVSLNIKKVMLWDLSFYQENMLPAPANTCFPKNKVMDIFKSVLKDAGGNLEILPIRVIVRDIPYGGLCIPVELGKDIRILLNPRDGFMGYDTLFHEMGHGIQAAGLGGVSNTIAAGDPPFFWEGIAGIYEHLMQAEKVLRKNFGLDEKSVGQIQARSKFFRMSWFRNIAIVCQLEWAAYRGEKDLRDLLQDLTRSYLGIDLPKDIGWAGNTLYTTHPLYNQNYLMMDVMALHTIESFTEQCGEFPSENLFTFINENYIKPAGWVKWRDKIKNATGKELSADALGRYLKI